MDKKKRSALSEINEGTKKQKSVKSSVPYSKKNLEDLTSYNSENEDPQRISKPSAKKSSNMDKFLTSDQEYGQEVVSIEVYFEI